MIRFPVRSVLFAMLLPVSLSAQQAPEVQAFVGVTVVPMDAERLLEDQTVLVRDGRIAAVGEATSIAIPEGARRIDGRGKFLLPGLAEMHGHLPLPSRFYPRRWPEDVLFLYLANGITTVRGMQGRQPHLEMRARIEAGELLGPRIFVAGPPLTGNSVRTPKDGAKAVREQAALGYDLLKIHEGIAPETYRAIARTAAEVGIPFGGHVPDAVGFFAAVQAGQITVDHLDNMYDAVDGDADRIGELVDALRDHSAWVVPTEVLWETAFLHAADPEVLQQERHEVRYVPAAMVANWSGMLQRRRAAGGGSEEGPRRVAFRRALVRALHEAGAGLLLGTDSPQIFSVPGFSIHREMAVMLEAGLSPYDVLAAGTRRVAEYFGSEADSGTVATGKRADLLLLEGNPLRSLTALADPAGVMVAGRFLDRAELQRRLAEIERAYARK